MVRHGALVIRPTRPEDLDWVLRAEGAPEQARFVSRWSRTEHAATLDRTDRAHWTVTVEDEPDPVAYIILAGLDDPNDNIELLRIVVTAKGRGIGRTLLRRVMAYAFEERGAHRLWLDVFEDNERAHALYVSEGFTEEGVLRECVRAAGGRRSLRVMSLLAAEYARRGGEG